MKVKYPKACITILDKYTHVCIEEEILLIIHNQQGRDFRDKKITLEVWEDFLENWYDPRDKSNRDEKLKFRKQLEKNIVWDPKIDPMAVFEA